MEAAIVVLGSGQDGGSPQLGHTSGVGPDRTASCVAAISPSGSVVLLDASPDMRQQVLSLMTSDAFPADRDTPFDAIALTHGHMGHYVGLVHLGKESGDVRGIRLLATGKMHTFLRRNEPWRTLYERGNVAPDTFGLGAIRVDDRMTIDAITVPHRAEFTDTVGLSVRLDDEPWFLYLPDIDSWGDWRQADETISSHPMCLLDATFSSAESHPMCLLDATFSSADELADRSVTEIKHPLVTDTIERFGSMTDSTRIVLGHINHSNPLADPESPIARDVAASGFVIAHDGMVLRL
jgi:pyrroloquinoline quinone biosynthesis protein B